MTVEAGEAAAPPVVGLVITGEPTGLYRFYDAANVLLYIGISRNLYARWGQHEADKTWWPLVVTRTVVMYPSRPEAEEAEGVAIRAENPVHNVAGREEPKPKPPRKPAAGRPSAFYLREGPRVFAPDPRFLASIDAFAEKRGISRGLAIGQLVLSGLVKDYQLENGTMEDVDAEFAAIAAYEEARRSA